MVITAYLYHMVYYIMYKVTGHSALNPLNPAQVNWEYTQSACIGCSLRVVLISTECILMGNCPCMQILCAVLLSKQFMQLHSVILSSVVAVI